MEAMIAVALFFTAVVVALALIFSPLIIIHQLGKIQKATEANAASNKETAHFLKWMAEKQYKKQQERQAV